MTQGALARLSRVPQSDLSRMERGMLYLGLTRALRLAAVLCVDVAEILPDKEVVVETVDTTPLALEKAS